MTDAESSILRHRGRVSNMGTMGERLELRPQEMTWSHESTKNMWKTDEKGKIIIGSNVRSWIWNSNWVYCLTNERASPLFFLDLLHVSVCSNGTLKSAFCDVIKVTDDNAHVSSFLLTQVPFHHSRLDFVLPRSIFARGCKQQAKCAGFWTSDSVLGSLIIWSCTTVVWSKNTYLLRWYMCIYIYIYMYINIYVLVLIFAFGRHYLLSKLPYKHD